MFDLVILCQLLDLEEKMDIATTCEKLLAELQETYEKYESLPLHTDRSPKKKLGDMFSGWLQQNPQSQVVHFTFLEGVEQLVTELAAQLALEPAACRDYAHRALQIIYAPKPKEERTDVERFLAIAEYQGAALYPYASREELQRIHKEQVERRPWRYMPPNQRKMLQQLEEFF